mgnify:CR=1 FL=1
MKIFKSIFYTILYGHSRLYPNYYKLEVLLFYLENIGIKTIKGSGDEFNDIIIFNDGTEYTYWNSNR